MRIKSDESAMRKRIGALRKSIKYSMPKGGSQPPKKYRISSLDTTILRRRIKDTKLQPKSENSETKKGRPLFKNPKRKTKKDITRGITTRSEANWITYSFLILLKILSSSSVWYLRYMRIKRARAIPVVETPTTMAVSMSTWGNGLT